MGYIENLTDQLELFTTEVELIVSKVVKAGYTKEQAIEITKHGVENIKAETMHHKNKINSEKNSILSLIADFICEFSKESGGIN